MITIRTAEPVTVWTGREVFGAQPYVTHTYDVRLEDTAAMWALEPECVGGLTGFNYFNRHWYPPFPRFDVPFIGVAFTGTMLGSLCGTINSSISILL